MINADPTPCFATIEELRIYWSMASPRPARELASRLGLRCVKGQYPWFAIWAAEGLAPPPSRLWPELKLPHMTTNDIAELLQESRRTAKHSSPV